MSALAIRAVPEHSTHSCSLPPPGVEQQWTPARNLDPLHHPRAPWQVVEMGQQGRKDWPRITQMPAAGDTRQWTVDSRQWTVDRGRPFRKSFGICGLGLATCLVPEAWDLEFACAPGRSGSSPFPCPHSLVPLPAPGTPCARQWTAAVLSVSRLILSIWALGLVWCLRLGIWSLPARRSR